MGLVISTFLRLLSPNKDYKVAIIGLDNAGKTTILYRMKLGKASDRGHTYRAPCASLLARLHRRRRDGMKIQ